MRKEANGTYKAAAEAETLASILNSRSGTHGDAFENLNDIARRWSHYITVKLQQQHLIEDTEEFDLGVADVATLMVEMKMSRATYGDAQEKDHALDIMGYAAIAAAWIEHELEIDQKVSELLDPNNQDAEKFLNPISQPNEVDFK